LNGLPYNTKKSRLDPTLQGGGGPEERKNLTTFPTKLAKIVVYQPVQAPPATGENFTTNGFLYKTAFNKAHK